MSAASVRLLLDEINAAAGNKQQQTTTSGSCFTSCGCGIAKGREGSRAILRINYLHVAEDLAGD